MMRLESRGKNKFSSNSFPRDKYLEGSDIHGHRTHVQGLPHDKESERERKGAKTSIARKVKG